MAKRQPPTAAHPPPKKGVTWVERREYLQNHALARDLAGWLTKLAKAEAKARKVNKFSVAELLDPMLRPWAWQRVRPLLEKELGVTLPVEPPPPPEELTGARPPDRSQSPGR